MRAEKRLIPQSAFEIQTDRTNIMKRFWGWAVLAAVLLALTLPVMLSQAGTPAPRYEALRATPPAGTEMLTGVDTTAASLQRKYYCGDWPTAVWGFRSWWTTYTAQGSDSADTTYCECQFWDHLTKSWGSWQLIDKRTTRAAHDTTIAIPYIKPDSVRFRNRTYDANTCSTKVGDEVMAR